MSHTKGITFQGVSNNDRPAASAVSTVCSVNSGAGYGIGVGTPLYPGSIYVKGIRAGLYLFLNLLLITIFYQKLVIRGLGQ